jgi:hypothetical protein
LTPLGAIDAIDSHRKPTTAVTRAVTGRPQRSDLVGLGLTECGAHGAGTSIDAPIAPAPQPTKRRRVTLPLYQKSWAHSCSFHFSVIASFSFLPVSLLKNSKRRSAIAGRVTAISNF